VPGFGLQGPDELVAASGCPSIGAVDQALITRSNLAYPTGTSGDVAGAIALVEQVLEARLRVLGPDHPAP
jgi:hypothetical protein